MKTIEDYLQELEARDEAFETEIRNKIIDLGTSVKLTHTTEYSRGFMAGIKEGCRLSYEKGYGDGFLECGKAILDAAQKQKAEASQSDT
jgi:hypothetical protein